MLVESISGVINGATNYFRGQGMFGGIFNRITFSILFAFFCFIANPIFPYFYLPALFAFTLLLWSFGWGKYFMAVDGADFRHEKEFFPSDWVLNTLVPPSVSNYTYGIIGMGVRWLILGLPLVAFYTYWEGYVRGLLITLCLSLVGVFYWLGGRINLKHGVSVSEFITGFMLTLALTIELT